MLPRLATAYSTLLLIQPGECSERSSSTLLDGASGQCAGDDDDCGRAVYLLLLSLIIILSGTVIILSA